MQKLSRTSITLTTVAAVLASTAASTAVAAPDAGSRSPSGQRVLADGVGAPFQIARRGRTVYYADGGAGKIFKVTRKGPKAVLTVPGVSGVEFSANRKVMAVAHGGGDPAGPPARVTLMRRGKKPVVADVGRYERVVNPDKNRTYGIYGSASTACRTQVENLTGAPSTYQGVIDSHPYQLARLRGGAFAVAEAGGNSILRVGPQGRISTIAVLPPQPVKLSAAQANALGAPACSGVTYAFEPVPTDVERGPHGSLLVSILPGGPESPALGARGAVYRIKRGVVTRVAGGFLGATNLAVVRGRVYVTELFAGKITKFGRGGRFTARTIANPVSVEATRKHLYVGTGVFGPGKVVRLPR